jgi:hypothetical protein
MYMVFSFTPTWWAGSFSLTPALTYLTTQMNSDPWSSDFFIGHF